MQYVLLTRHTHQNTKLGRFLGVGDLVHSEDPALVRELLEMRGGSHYSPAGFSNVSGQGFSYFSAENFSVRDLRAALAELEPAPKAAAKVEAPVAKPEPVVAEAEPVAAPVVAAEEPAKAEPRGRKRVEAEAEAVKAE